MNEQDSPLNSIPQGLTFPPVMAWRHFALVTGNDEGVVRGWIDKGYIPVIRLGKHVQVNVAALLCQLLEGV